MATFGWGPGYDYDLRRLFSPGSAGFGAPNLSGVQRPENVTGDEYGNLWQMQGENRVPWVDPAPVSSAAGVDTPEEYAYALAQPFAGNAEQYRYWLAAHTSPEAAGLWGRMQAGETLSPGMRAALEHPDKLGQDLLRTGLPWDAWAAPSSTDNPAAQQAILDKYPGLVPDERASAWAANNTAAAQAARDDDGLRQILPALAVLGMPFALQGLTGLLGAGEIAGAGGAEVALGQAAGDVLGAGGATEASMLGPPTGTILGPGVQASGAVVTPVIDTMAGVAELLPTGGLLQESMVGPPTGTIQTPGAQLSGAITSPVADTMSGVTQIQAPGLLDKIKLPPGTGQLAGNALGGGGQQGGSEETVAPHMWSPTVNPQTVAPGVAGGFTPQGLFDFGASGYTNADLKRRIEQILRGGY